MNLTLSRLWRTFQTFFRTEGGLEGKEIPTPLSPSAGYSRAYPKTDHKWYRLDSDGNEVELAGVRTYSLVASENLVAGNKINIWNDGGTMKMRKANATDSSKPPHGHVKASITSGDTGTAYLVGGINDAISGLIGGTVYYLDTTAGAVSATPPSSEGSAIWRYPAALSATELPDDPDFMYVNAS